MSLLVMPTLVALEEGWHQETFTHQVIAAPTSNNLRTAFVCLIFVSCIVNNNLLPIYTHYSRTKTIALMHLPYYI